MSELIAGAPSGGGSSALLHCAPVAEDFSAPIEANLPQLPFAELGLFLKAEVKGRRTTFHHHSGGLDFIRRGFVTAERL